MIGDGDRPPGSPRGRVMIIIARLNIGGPAGHVVWLAAGLKQAGYEVDLVCGEVSPGEGDMSAFAGRQGIEPILIPELRRDVHVWRDLAAGWKLVRLMRRRRPHIVHTHTAKAGFLGRWAAWLTHRPIIVHTFHGHVFRGYFGRAKTRLAILLEQATARITQAIITLSPRLREELATTYKIAEPGRIHIVPLGIDPTALRGCRRRCRGRFRKDQGIPPDVPLVGIVGRLVPVKNHRLFLEAAIRVGRKVPETHFAIVGDGVLRERLKAEAAELGLGNRVHFTGWTRKLSHVYADLDVTVLSSMNEGTPVSLIESMAAGCPVVATDVGGVRDLLGNEPGATLVSPGDAEQMSCAIVAALQGPVLDEALSARVCDRFALERFVAETAAVYHCSGKA